MIYQPVVLLSYLNEDYPSLNNMNIAIKGNDTIHIICSGCAPE